VNSLKRFLSLAATGVLALTAGLACAQVPVPANATIYASGLNGPRGLVFGPDGALYVAEAGMGGTLSTVGACTQVAAPVGPYAGGTTGRITKIVKGTASVVAVGLPSTIDQMGDVSGVADLAFVNGNLYALLSGGGCSHGNPTLPNGIVRVNLRNGNWRYINDLSLVLAEHPPANNSYNDFEPDGQPYSLVAENGALFLAEANHAQIFRITTAGAAKLAFDFSLPFGDVTPTGIAFREGNLYVGNLGIFPARTTTERITTLSRDVVFFDTTPGLETRESDIGKLRVAGSRAGFTSIISIKFGPDGLLYAVEFSAANGYPTPGAGKVVRLNRDGVIEDVVTGLTVPTGMAFGPDDAMYISNAGAAPAGAGEILRVQNY
jgi:glucose/arabinose dehydrogenase